MKSFVLQMRYIYVYFVDVVNFFLVSHFMTKTFGHFFKESILYSLQGFFYNDDPFNFNYAQAKAALGNYKEAEEVS